MLRPKADGFFSDLRGSGDAFGTWRGWYVVLECAWLFLIVDSGDIECEDDRLYFSEYILSGTMLDQLYHTDDLGFIFGKAQRSLLWWSWFLYRQVVVVY